MLQFMGWQRVELVTEHQQINKCVVLSYCVISDSLQPMDCSPQGSSVHVDFLGKNPVVGYYFLLQGIFPTQGSNPGLPNCRQILYQLSHQGSQINITGKQTGLPWWLSGKRLACQCRRHGFDPWSGKIPHAAKQLSPCTTTFEPVL